MSRSSQGSTEQPDEFEGIVPTGSADATIRGASKVVDESAAACGTAEEADEQFMQSVLDGAETLLPREAPEEDWSADPSLLPEPQRDGGSRSADGDLHGDLHGEAGDFHGAADEQEDADEEDVLVAAERAVSAEVPTRKGVRAAATAGAVERPPELEPGAKKTHADDEEEQRIGVADGGRTDLCGLDRLHAFVAHMLDTTGKEHVNRHKEYLKLRVVDGRSASYAARNMGLAILLAAGAAAALVRHRCADGDGNSLRRGAGDRGGCMGCGGARGAGARGAPTVCSLQRGGGGGWRKGAVGALVKRESTGCEEAEQQRGHRRVQVTVDVGVDICGAVVPGARHPDGHPGGSRRPRRRVPLPDDALAHRLGPQLGIARAGGSD